MVERYYAPWQVHVVARLRKLNSVPENTEQVRSLRGMATGFDALERYRYADQVALGEAFGGVPDGEPLAKPAQDQFRAVLTTWARRSLK